MSEEDRRAADMLERSIEKMDIGYRAQKMGKKQHKLEGHSLSSSESRG